VTSLAEALEEIRPLLHSPGLVRAVARDAADGTAMATLRPVSLKAGTRLQLVVDDGVRPTTSYPSPDEVERLLAGDFKSWVVETDRGTVRLQRTKKGAILHRSSERREVEAQPHDRVKEHLLDPGDPIFEVIGGNAAKRRQVDAFLRQLPRDLPHQLHVVDLGCGNAYLTFAAYRFLAQQGHDVTLTGVDVREDQRERNSALAARLGWSDRVRFVAASIEDARVDKPDLVLALHACDTATDDALARAVQWGAKWILAAPCCHKDINRQLRAHEASPKALLTEHGILRERFADVLTDTIRAALLREHGYDVEVVEFIDSAHTPRNAMVKAVHTGQSTRDDRLADLLREWQITPALARRLPAPH
jgi:SAM-dependent methyltransferase